MKILIVDDDKDVADSLATLLDARGYDVAVSYAVHEGLSEAQRLSPDVILHDIAMPKMDGYDAARRLRTHAQFAQTLILAVTAFDGPADREKAQTAGFNGPLGKPVDLALLVEILQGGVPSDV